MKSDKIIVALDFGNTRLKLKDGDETFSLFYDESIIEKLNDVFSGRNVFVAYSTVNPEKSEKYLNLSIFRNIEKKDVFDLINETGLLKYDKISGIGADRLAGLAGGLSLSEPPLITVDIGTAVTVNALDKGFNVLGGAIFPGPETQAVSLEKNTAQLLNTKIKIQSRFPGKNTDEAINTGILGSVSGGIEKIVKRFADEIFPGVLVPVYVTGGGSELIFPLFAGASPLRYTHIPSLVPDGLIYLAERSFSG